VRCKNAEVDGVRRRQTGPRQPHSLVLRKKQSYGAGLLQRGHICFRSESALPHSAERHIRWNTNCSPHLPKRRSMAICQMPISLTLERRGGNEKARRLLKKRFESQVCALQAAHWGVHPVVNRGPRWFASRLLLYVYAVVVVVLRGSSLASVPHKRPVNPRGRSGGIIHPDCGQKFRSQCSWISPRLVAIRKSVYVS